MMQVERPMTISSKTIRSIGTLEIDAKLEGVTSKAVTLTQYPLEFGANSNDHAILMPDRYLLTGAVSNRPLGLDLGDIGMMGAGAIASAVGGIAGAAISSVSAYLLSGSDMTRVNTAWGALTALLESRGKFDLWTGKELMRDMVIIRLDERTTPENEDGLVFIAELQQVRIVRSKIGRGVKSADQLMQNDTVAAQGAPMVITGDAAVEVLP